MVRFDKEASPMYEKAITEPPLAELFDDPIVQLLMKRDGVVMSDLQPMLEQIHREEEIRNAGK